MYYAWNSSTLFVLNILCINSLNVNVNTTHIISAFERFHISSQMYENLMYPCVRIELLLPEHIKNW